MTGAVDRRTPPAAGAPHAFQFAAFDRRRLGNGFELLLCPHASVPLAHLTLLLPAGADRNPREQPGLAHLTAALVDEGTRRRSGLELAWAVERLGASLSTHSSWNSASIELSSLDRDFEAALELVAEVAQSPSFPDEEVERLRRQTLTEIDRRRDQAGVQADLALAAALYGDGLYGRPLLGTRESLGLLSRAEISDFHADGYRPSGAHLIAVGAFDCKRAGQRVEELFGGSWGRSGSEPPVSPVTGAGSRRVVIVDRPTAAQTELRVGQVGPPRSHPDRTALGLLNAVLGGKFTSRLNLNLRERHGFTYGVSSRFVDRRGPGPFVIATALGNEVVGAATVEIYAELERLVQEPISRAELGETQSYLLGVFPFTLQTIGGVAARLADLALYGLPDDHFDRALAQIARATSPELLELARRHLKPDQSVIVAAGPAATLAAQLEPFGPIEIVEQPRS